MNQMSKIVRPAADMAGKVDVKEVKGNNEDEDFADDDENDDDDEDDDAAEEEEEEEETFLVCVHNVSPEIPYVILKCRVADTAKDILQQALLKVIAPNLS